MGVGSAGDRRTIGGVGMINTFRSVVQFDRIALDPVERRLQTVRLGRGHATDREASTPTRGVRLHRWRRRGRAHARTQRRRVLSVPVRAASTAGRQRSRHVDRPVRAPAVDAADHRADRVHPDRGLARRVGGCPGCGTSGDSVLAVDDGNPIDRRGRGRQRRRQVVPDLHLARSAARGGTGGSSEGRRLHDGLDHGRHRGARTART